MTEGVKTIMYPVTDLAEAKAQYGKLVGVEPYADEPYYVGFRVGGQDVGLAPNGHGKGMTGPLAYWHVDDIEEKLKAFLNAGAEAQQEVKHIGGGKLIASVKDAGQRHRAPPVALVARGTSLIYVPVTMGRPR
jgi:predicted enzyme related to lactoylglutathione lyase